MYSARFDQDDVVERGLILLQWFFIAAVMAANAKEALGSRSSTGLARRTLERASGTLPEIARKLIAQKG